LSTSDAGLGAGGVMMGRKGSVELIISTTNVSSTPYGRGFEGSAPGMAPGPQELVMAFKALRAVAMRSAMTSTVASWVAAMTEGELATVSGVGCPASVELAEAAQRG
jgi:hypothetical protein